MSNEAPYQVNLKTPKGSLLNLRAWDEQQLDTILDGLEVRMQRILQLEETIDELHKLSSNPAAQAIQTLQNAGLNPVPVAPAQPIGNQSVKSAVLVISVEVFQSRVAAGGQIEGVDFTSTPYRIGRSLYSRVIGILGPYVDVEGICQ